MTDQTPPILVTDVETTGLDPSTGAALLEIATVDLQRTPTNAGWRLDGWSSYIEYGGRIPSQAKAVHHITEDRVAAGAPQCMSRGALYERMEAVPRDTVFCFHNAAFDLRFLPELEGRPVICTYRAALHIYPELGSHSLQALRYELGVEPPAELIAGLAPHAALYDTACTAALLAHMLKNYSVAELLEFTERPAILHKCKFGRYRGVLWSEVPRDYLRWLLRENLYNKFDDDVVETARYWLNNGSTTAPAPLAR